MNELKDIRALAINKMIDCVTANPVLVAQKKGPEEAAFLIDGAKLIEAYINGSQEKPQ